MNHERNWNDDRNAVGFAAACARLALPFYSGDRRSDLVVAIEIAERCANGEQIDSAAAYFARGAANDAAHATAYASEGPPHPADPAAYAASAACYATTTTDADVARDAADTVHWASKAGVDDSEIQVAYARWVIRDLNCGRDFDEELRQAAGAAVVAGDEALARELLG